MMRRWLLPVVIGVVAAAIGWQLALVAIPRVLMAVAVNRVSRAGGVNRMVHAPIVTDRSRAIVRPSPDLLYSSCPFDLRSGPVLVDVPAIAAPYWSLSVFDDRTNVAFVGNNIDAGAAPIRIAIARDGQGVRAGYRAVRVRGGRGIALVRVLIDRTRPITAIDRARRAARCRPAG